MSKVVIATESRPVRLAVGDSRDSAYLVVRDGSRGMGYAIGHGLKLEHGVLMVDAAEAVEADNTKPITSAAVYTEVGNINALLATI